ncbi:COG1361 S-layer family protein [Candidatus Woesearchaeota archaeon]|nr:COG1361 S-layer family protein [Candidatus Woesearchaeota archaeon]
MKRLCYIILFILLTSYAYAQGYVPVTGTESAKFEILVADISPHPVKPGQDFLLQVMVENNGNREARNLKLELDLKGPFSFKHPSEELISIAQISPSSKYLAEYHLLANYDAKSGVYEPKFFLTHEGRVYFKDVKISVVGVPDLTITDVTKSSTVVKPGDNFTLGFSITNKGTGMAKNVRVSLNLNNSLIAQPDNTEYISSIEIDESADTKFDLIVGKNAEVKVYNIPITLTSLDEMGNTITSTETVNIEVIGSAKLNPAQISTTPPIVYSGQDFTLIVRVENSGKGDAKRSNAVLYMPFGETSNSFMGIIEPGEDLPAVYMLKAGKAGKYDYSMKIYYTDDLGEHETTHSIQVYITKKPLNITLIFGLAIAVILVLAYFLFKKRRK